MKVLCAEAADHENRLKVHGGREIGGGRGGRLARRGRGGGKPVGERSLEEDSIMKLGRTSC